MSDHPKHVVHEKGTHPSAPRWSPKLSLLLAICWVLACVPLVDWCIRGWSSVILGGAATALLSIPIALVLGGLSARRALTESTPPANADWAYAVQLVLLTVLTAVTDGEGPWMLAVGFCAIGCVWTWLWGCLGWSMAKNLILPVFFIVFALPWEFYLRPLVQMPLQAWTTDIAMAMLKSMDYSVWYHNDHTIDSKPYYVIVNETCSGINMVVALTMYTLIFSWAVEAHMKTRLGLVALIFPVAMLANGVRVTVIYLMGYYGGEALANGPWHTGSAYLIFLPIFWFMYVAYQFLERRVQDAAHTMPTPVE